MIIEDYCSFETAMLLKEKGFDAEIKTYWCNDTICPYLEFIPDPTKRDISNSGGYKYPKDLAGEVACIAPTLQLAMKWLREKQNLYIEIRYANSDKCFSINIKDMSENGTDDSLNEFTDWYDTYEEAAEAAIKYCLENLI